MSNDTPSTITQITGPGTTSAPEVYRIDEDLKLFKEAFHVYDAKNAVTMVAEAKALTLKNEIKIFSDESKQKIVAIIKQKNILGRTLTWDVLNASGNVLGSFKLNMVKSFLNEKWEIVDADGKVIGTMVQDLKRSLIARVLKNASKSSMRSFLQVYKVTVNGQPACTYEDEYSSIRLKMTANFTAGKDIYDRTLGLAGAILIASRHDIQS